MTKSKYLILLVLIAGGTVLAASSPALADRDGWGRHQFFFSFGVGPRYYSPPTYYYPQPQPYYYYPQPYRYYSAPRYYSYPGHYSYRPYYYYNRRHHHDRDDD